jgi:hypothetical protein
MLAIGSAPTMSRSKNCPAHGPHQPGPSMRISAKSSATSSTKPISVLIENRGNLTVLFHAGSCDEPGRMTRAKKSHCKSVPTSLPAVNNSVWCPRNYDNSVWCPRNYNEPEWKRLTELRRHPRVASTRFPPELTTGPTLRRGAKTGLLKCRLHGACHRVYSARTHELLFVHKNRVRLATVESRYATIQAAASNNSSAAIQLSFEGRRGSRSAMTQDAKMPRCQAQSSHRGPARRRPSRS